MTTSRQTFTQVKDILRKIDRSITDARERRLRDEGALSPRGSDSLRRPDGERNGGVDRPGSPLIGGSEDRFGVRAG